jgi:hypothetical protein
MRQVAKVLLLVAGVGCGRQVVWDGTTPGPGTIPIVGPVTPPSFDGLPCEVAAVLQNRCTSCHGATLAGGAPYELASRADLQALAPPPYGASSRGQRSVDRMAAAASPMPPPPAAPASASDLATLAGWVDAGMPAGSCGPPQVLCTSHQTSTVREGSNMEPGAGCQGCHVGGEAQAYQFMGTVYPTLHEPDRCNGAPPSSTALVVEILDAATGATVLTLPVYSPSGNFYSSRGTAATPYRARVRNTLTNLTREMVGPQSDGNCDSCHTALGTSGAPGRIAWPN